MLHWSSYNSFSSHPSLLTNDISPTFIILKATQVFISPDADNPYHKADELIAKLKNEEHCTSILLDFHAETTSEKIVMGRYLDGRVTCVVGTHTHVQTADDKILPGGTGYISDVGMTGAEDSVLGMKTETSVTRLVYKMPARYEPATGPAMICGVVRKVSGDKKVL